MADAALLEVQGLRKRFEVRGGFGRRAGFVDAVHDVSFSLARGESLALVGESGSGKTTAARIIVGLETPTGGCVRLDGAELASRPDTAERRRRARVAQIVFQNPYASLDPRQTARRAIEEVLAFHLGLDREARKARAGELLESVGLGQREAESKPRQLSGGQCQRVAIARALAVEPQLLVLDEAVSALDVSVQAQILNLLADLRAELGVALLSIAHDLAVVHQLADQVLVMYRGRIVESGPVEAVLRSPAHPYTRRLIESAPDPGAELPKPSPMFDEVGEGCRYRGRCPLAFERCTAEPGLLPVVAGHDARCWLVDEDVPRTPAAANHPAEDSLL